MLHTLQLLKNNFTMLILAKQVEGSGSGASDSEGQSKWIINDKALESLPLEDSPEKQAVHQESSQQREEVRKEVVNMDIINSAGTIRPGSEWESVKELQKFLNKYYDFKLPIDGDFGFNTLNAVKVLQYNNQLGTDGVIGKNTKAAMRNVINVNKVIKEPIADATPSNIFTEDTVSWTELNEQLDTTQAKLDALNNLIVNSTAVLEALEAYINGGQRGEIISDKGWVWGWLRTTLGKNNFDDYMTQLVSVAGVNVKNINDGLNLALKWSNHKKPLFSPQSQKDIALMASSVLLSSGNTLSLPIFHLRNPFIQRLTVAGMNMTQANNFSAYIEQTAGQEAFDPSREYVSDNGLDALGATAQLTNMLREYGISENEIGAALQGEVGETSDKIRTVTQSFLTHIVVRDIDAVVKWSFNMAEKNFYIPTGKRVEIPGNPGITIPKSSFFGDSKFSGLGNITKAMKAAIATLSDDNVSIGSVLDEIDRRMEGVDYLLDKQVNDHPLSRGWNKAKRNLIEKSVGDLNEKVDYMNELMWNAEFFDSFVSMSENRELVREYSVLKKFDSIETILNKFPTTREVSNQLLSLSENASEQEFRDILDNSAVSEYLATIPDAQAFKEYRIANLEQREGLKEITVATTGKHGLPVDRNSTGDEVLREMLAHTVDGKYSVMTSIERTLIDNGITSITEWELAEAMLKTWEVVDIAELSGVAINTARGGWTTNDEITTFAELAEKKGDSFMFRTEISETTKFLDKNGAEHTLEHTYSIYFRPECKNPIIHPGIVKVNGSVIDPTSPEFNTAVPALLTSTIPVWVNIDLEGSDPVIEQEPEQPAEPETPVEPEVPEVPETPTTPEPPHPPRPPEPPVTPPEGPTPTQPGTDAPTPNPTVDPVAPPPTTTPWDPGWTGWIDTPGAPTTPGTPPPPPPGG